MNNKYKVSNNMKTRFCRGVTGGVCRSYKNCKFAHSIEDISPLKCRNGLDCKFKTTCYYKHGDESTEEYAYRLGYNIPNKCKYEIRKLDNIDKEIEKVDKEIDKVNKEIDTGVEMMETCRKRGGYKRGSCVVTTRPCIRYNGTKPPVDPNFYTSMIISAKTDDCFSSDFDEVYFPKYRSNSRKNSSEVSKNWWKFYGNVNCGGVRHKKLSYSKSTLFGKKQKPPRLTLLQKQTLSDDIENDWNNGNLMHCERAYIVVENC